MNTLQEIFSDHFDTVAFSGINIRSSVFENVSKMVSCGDFNNGFKLYGCESCGKFHKVAFTCKSRFCTSCGNQYSKIRSTKMSFKLIHTTHRHCVFTIPEELRVYFRMNRNLLNCLFHSVRDVILRMFSKMSKSENFTPGFVCVLHTFGRSLQWNPHIHVLLSEGATGNSTVWRKVKHFNYEFLRKSFQTVLLNALEKHIGSSFKKVKSSIYKNSQNGFYVYAKPMPKQSSVNDVIKYIGRYLGRPVIATSRIDNYDGENVTFHYNRHEDDLYVEETIPATEFIKRLIIHIPDKFFRMVRYYGVYAKKHKQSSKLFLAVNKQKRRFLLRLNTWKTSLLQSFGVDPLLCSCGHQLTFLESCPKGTPLFEMEKGKFNSS